jgi:hypothetical protein
MTPKAFTREVPKKGRATQNHSGLNARNVNITASEIRVYIHINLGLSFLVASILLIYKRGAKVDRINVAEKFI